MKAGVTFAQFVMMIPFPGTVDFGEWEKRQSQAPTMVGDVPITRYLAHSGGTDTRTHPQSGAMESSWGRRAER